MSRRHLDIGAALTALFISAASAAGATYYCGGNDQCLSLAESQATANLYPKGQGVPANEVVYTASISVLETTTASGARA